MSSTSAIASPCSGPTRSGTLSLVYPIARGTGPLLATLGAIIILGERPGLLAISGIGLLALGIFQVAGVGRREQARGRAAYLGAAYALLPAIFTAAYTVWDKYCMGILMVPPVFYLWFNHVVRAIIWSPPHCVTGLRYGRFGFNTARRQSPSGSGAPRATS